MSLAEIQAQNRRNVGAPVTVGGVKTYAITASDTSPVDNLPDGSRNAANADRRIFNVTPADFAAMPAEGSTLAWLGTNYTVTAVLPVVYAGEIVSYRLKAYRSPQPGTSTQDAAQAAMWNYNPLP